MTIKKEKRKKNPKTTAEKQGIQILYCQRSSYEKTTGRIMYLKSAELSKGKIKLYRLMWVKCTHFIIFQILLKDKFAKQIQIILKKQPNPFCCKSHLQGKQEAPSAGPPTLFPLLTTTNFLLHYAWALVICFIPSHSACSKLFFRVQVFFYFFLSCLPSFPSFFPNSHPCNLQISKMHFLPCLIASQKPSYVL